VSVRNCDVGRGLFADRRFVCGEKILVFDGIPFSRNDNGEKILVFDGIPFSRNDSIHATEAGANLLQTDSRRYILPNPPGVFVNHSCNPNAGIASRRRLIAVRNIEVDEEIRFDYSTTMDEELWTMQCLCGEPNCRRTIGDFKYLPVEVRERYVGLGIVPGFIRRSFRRVIGPGDLVGGEAL